MNHPTQPTATAPLAATPVDTSTAANYSGKRKAFVLVMLLVSWILANADRMAMSISIIPISKDFNLDAQSAGLLLSAFYVSYSLMQLVAGRLSDRFGSRAVLLFSVACWSVFTGLTGLASTFASLIVIRVLFGIGEGGFVPASTVTVSEAFPRGERARAKSLVIGASFLGSAVGSSAIAALVHTHGWRYAYHVFGLVGMVVAVVLWLAIKRPPRRQKLTGKLAFLALARSAMLRKTMLIFFFSNIVYVALISWMPSFLIKTRHIDILHAGLASAGPYLVAFVCLNIVGWMLDKVGQGRERLFMTCGACAVVIFFALMAFADSLPSLLILWTLCLVGYTVIYGTVFAIPLKHMPDESVGSAAGIINFGGQVAAAIAPAMVGMFVDLTPGSYGWAYCALLVSGMAALLMSLTWRTECRSFTASHPPST